MLSCISNLYPRKKEEMKNFALKVSVDGKVHIIAPNSHEKSGGMLVKFYGSDKGIPRELVCIDAYTSLDKLCINVYLNGSKEPEIFILNRKEENEKNTEV